MVTPDTSKKAKKFKNLDFLPIANSTFQQKTFDDEEEERLFYIQSARSGLQDNLEFYTGLLEESVDNLSVKAAKFIEAKITRTQYHLENLDSGAVSNDVFVIDEVAS